MKTKNCLLILCLLSSLVSAQDIDALSFPIVLKGGIIETDPSTSLDYPGDSNLGSQILLLQFSELPEPAELQKNGIVSLYYVADLTILAMVPEGFHRDDFSELRWMGYLPPAMKVANEVSESLFNDQQETYMVYGYPGMAASDLAAKVADVGAYSETRGKLPEYVQLVNADFHAIQQLAQNNDVTWITTAPKDGEIVHFCAGAMTQWGPVSEFSTNGNGWDGAGLGSAALRYFFVNGTPDISGTGEQAAFRSALNAWAAVADLTFTQITTANQTRSFDVRWASGNHGDGSNFDGPNGVLAHAFFPVGVNTESIAGDVHFDEAETWSLTNTYDMFSVSLHEIGHSLGLNHSSVSAAVMAPTYKKVTGLNSDDISGIRSIYSSGLPAPRLSSFNECRAFNSLEWNAISGATSYQIYWGTSTNSSSASYLKTVTGTSSFINSSSTRYAFVRACNSTGCGAFSNAARVYYRTGICP